MPDPAAAAPSPPPTGADRRWLAPDEAFLATFLRLPELAIVEESSTEERRLHERLLRDPLGSVEPGLLEAVADADVRANFAMFLGFREALRAAGTLEAYYLAMVRSGRVAVPPVFVEKTVEAISRHLLGPDASPFERRAAQLLHRQQRITVSGGRVLAADREALDRTGAPDASPIGTPPSRGRAGAGASTLPVLGPDNAAGFDLDSDRSFVFDLTHEVASEVGHGLTFTLTRAHSGLAALARVLERWIDHFLHVKTTIRPLQRIDDPAWVWHIGLDTESTAVLNDLYRGESVDELRLQRLIGLFRLDFADPAQMRADVAGKPVYLGLAMNDEQTLKLKPQNLLLNLPLADPV